MQNRAIPLSPGRRFDPRRRLRILGLVFLLLAAAVQNVSSWLTYRAVRRTLDTQLGEQLVAVASATAAGIPSTWVRSVSRAGAESAHWPSLRTHLERLAQDAQAGNLLLVDTDKRNLYDRRNRFPMGFVNPLLELHFAPVTAALAGVPAATALYQVGDAYLKAGYAPVLEGDEVVGVVGVEGDARFFRVLAELKRVFLVAGSLGLVSMLVLGVLLLRILHGLERAEATLAQSSALAAAGELAAMVAHEIRNPLAVIRSRAERVRSKIERGADRDDILKWFDVIPEEVDRLNRILSGYLAFARPSADAASGGGVARALQAARNLLERECSRRGIELEVRSELPSDVRVVVTSHDLQQILVNLMLNAVQALDPRGGTIAVSAREDGAAVDLLVEDSGPGIEASVREKVFDPFFTTKPTGSGLGLAIVRMLVQAGGGRIVAEPSRLGGAAFRVTLSKAPAGGTPPADGP